MKSGDSGSNLPTILSIDLDDASGTLDRSMAPLASSETFSDGISICCDEQDKALATAQPNGLLKSEKPSNLKATSSNFDSLEVLFDFSSSSLTNEPPTEPKRSSETPSRIRFSDNIQTINPSKVRMQTNSPTYSYLPRTSASIFAAKAAIL